MKIILLLLIINILFSKRQTNYLYCGLFGWVGSNPSTFSRHAFSILGIANDDRGGDSCGVYSNNTIRYGTGYTKDFPTFIKKSDKIRAGKDCVVLGHTRRASIGLVNANNSQPVVLEGKDETAEFVLTHNGTLFNHHELAKKHDLDTKNLNTDSQILAALLKYSKVGFDILKEYSGTAALVFHYPGSKTIYIFKGNSKNSSNALVTSEERPLYGYCESEHSFYYSSLKSPLELIAKDPENIFDIKCNTLIRVTGGKIMETIDIDRSTNYQRYIAPYTPPVRSKYNDYSSYSADLFEDDQQQAWHGWPGTTRRSLPDSPTQYHSPNIPIIEEAFASMGDGIINFNKGRYHLGNNMVHGEVTVNEYGLVVDPEVFKNQWFTLYFWEGILLIGEDAFLDLMLLKKNIKYISCKHLGLLEASPYPIASYEKAPISGDSKLYTEDDVLNRPNVFDGKFAPIFCNKEYYVIKGLLSRTTKSSTINKLKNDKISLLNYWGNNE